MMIVVIGLRCLVIDGKALPVGSPSKDTDATWEQPRAGASPRGLSYMSCGARNFCLSRVRARVTAPTPPAAAENVAGNTRTTACDNARRLQDASEEFCKRYRWRAGIEATMSRFKHQMGMAKLRIRGMAKVTYTEMLRALGLNIHRVAAYRAAIG